jgi:heptosyltransferase-2
LHSGAARRVAYSEHVNPRKQVLNAGFDRWFTDVVASEGVAHEVQRHLTLLRVLGARVESAKIALWPTDADRARARAALSDVPGQSRIVAFGIGAAHPKRRWPISRFAQLGVFLQREVGAHVVIVGGPSDLQAQAELLRAIGPAATALAGRLTLPQTAAALAGCALFVGNDSAPLHLAAAAGVPCVEISCHPEGADPMHNNAPERFGAWGVPSAIVRPARATAPCTDSCSASGPHCILEVAPDTVGRASVGLWSRAGGAVTEAPPPRGASSHQVTTFRARESRE